MLQVSSRHPSHPNLERLLIAALLLQEANFFGPHYVLVGETKTRWLSSGQILTQGNLQLLLQAMWHSSDPHNSCKQLTEPSCAWVF
jgi:hypothetical protein